MRKGFATMDFAGIIDTIMGALGSVLPEEVMAMIQDLLAKLPF